MEFICIKNFGKNKIIAYSLFTLVMVVLTSSIHIQSSFAQLGLSPMPVTQEVLPTYIIDIPAGSVSSEASLHYVPSKITIPSGTTIAWFNDDPGQVHTVTSGHPGANDAGRTFNSGYMPFGAFYQITLDNPGDYYYHCTLHPYMTGFIHVGGAQEEGHHFTMTSGADLVPVNSTMGYSIVDWTINKTQNDRTLLDFKPTGLAIEKSTPLVYNLKIDDKTNNKTMFDNNFQVIGGSGLQVELISDNNMNHTNVYGPDVTDPITGAYHVEQNFVDGNYVINVKAISVGNDILEDNVSDEFGLRIVS